MPETLQYITGLVLWTMTLADYLTDQLFELNRILNVPDSFDVDLLREQGSFSPLLPSSSVCTVVSDISYLCSHQVARDSSHPALDESISPPLQL